MGVGGWWQRLKQRNKTIQNDRMYSKRANISLQGLDRHVLTVGATSGPTAKLETSIAAISPVVDLHGWKQALRRSKPVDISQWRQLTCIVI